MYRTFVWAWLLLTAAAPALHAEPPTVRAALRSVTISGYTRSRAVMSLSSEVPGKVLRVNYDIGQAAGSDPFLEIDTTFIDFEIEQLAGQLGKLKVAQTQAASRAAYLAKEFGRIEQLFKSEAATETGRDAAAEEARQARLTQASTEIEISSLNSRLSELRERRKRHRVFVPAGWVVVERRVEPGEIVAAGTPLARAADFSRLVVPLFVSGRELSVLERPGGVKAEVEGRTLRADLHWVNPEFDESTRKRAVELILSPGSGLARGGLTVELRLPVPGEGIMIPKSAILNHNDNPRVVVENNGRSVPIVVLGENGDDLIAAATPDLPVGTVLRPQQPASPK